VMDLTVGRIKRKSLMRQSGAPSLSTKGYSIGQVPVRQHITGKVKRSILAERFLGYMTRSFGSRPALSIGAKN